MPYKTQDARRVVFPTPRIVVSYHVPTGVGSCVVGHGISPEPNSDNTRLTFRLFIQAEEPKIEKDMLPLRMKTVP